MNNETGVVELTRNQQKKLAAQEHNRKMREQTTENRKPTPEETVELEALSKEVFNAKSRYVTLMTKGEVVPVTETVTEYVPGEDGAEGTTKEVQAPVYAHNATRGKKSVILKTVVHTVESVRELMLERKRQQDAFRAMIAKMQADQKAAAEQAKRKKEVQDKLSGSAI